MGQYEKLRSLLYEQTFKILKRIRVAKKPKTRSVNANDIDLLFLKARVEKPEDWLEEEEPEKELLTELLVLLNKSEMRVINAIYFTGEGVRRIKDAAEELGLSVRRVEQIKKMAYKKMCAYDERKPKI